MILRLLAMIAGHIFFIFAVALLLLLALPLIVFVLVQSYFRYINNAINVIHICTREEIEAW